MKDKFKWFCGLEPFIGTLIGSVIGFLGWYLSNNATVAAWKFVLTTTALLLVIQFLTGRLIDSHEQRFTDEDMLVESAQPNEIIIIKHKPYILEGHIVSVFYEKRGIDYHYSIGRVENIQSSESGIASVKLLCFDDEAGLRYDDLIKDATKIKQLRVRPLCKANHIKQVERKKF